MRTDLSRALHTLSEREQECVHRYLALLVEMLGDKLAQVRLFGSAARGDMWSARMPMRSDIDLLVLTREPLSHAVQEQLGDETYPFFLECGRQIGPLFHTVSWFEEPGDQKARDVVARIADEGVILYQN